MSLLLFAAFQLFPSSPTAVIGAPLELTGTAVFPDRYALEGPDKDQNSEPFQLLAVEQGIPQKEGSDIKLPLRVRAAAFALGEVELPALHWTLRAKDGSSEILESSPLHLKITGPKPPPSADIKDIAGPITVVVWPWFLALAVAILAFSYLLWRRRRRPIAAAMEQALPPDTRTPEQMALDELKALAATDLPVKEYYDGLSDIFRVYLDRRFQIPALHMTTSDLNKRLVRGSVDSASRTKVKALLDRCDLAKFARFAPTTEERVKDCRFAEEIISSFAGEKTS